MVALINRLLTYLLTYIGWWYEWWRVRSPSRSAYIISIFPWCSIGRCFRCRFLRLS